MHYYCIEVQKNEKENDYYWGRYIRYISFYFIKKISWIFALVLGFAIDYFVKVNIFLIGSALVCVTTEGISVYENFGELGIKLKFNKYFEKIKDCK